MKTKKRKTPHGLLPAKVFAGFNLAIKVLPKAFVPAIFLLCPFPGGAIATEPPCDSTLMARYEQNAAQAFTRPLESRLLPDSAFNPRCLILDSLVKTSLTDSVISARFSYLNASTPIELSYNDPVKAQVLLYLERRKQLTSRVLTRIQFYFEHFEQSLDKHDLPLELKYVSIIESALNPTARSWAGASGLWQFMAPTARMYDLQVGFYVDERYDMHKASDAAARHLKDLYNVYNDWLLVLAAYNCGSGNLNRAIRRAGGEKDFWKVRPFLPRETQAYVPAFIAVNYVFSYAHKHYISPGMASIPLQEADTVTIKQRVHFDQIAEAMNIDKEVLKTLNPAFQRGIIPASDKRYYSLFLPQIKVNDFIIMEDSIYAYKTKAQKEMEKRLAEKYGPVVQGTHVVRSGESLGAIANKYGCTVSHIKEWNGLRSSLIHPGDALIIFAPEKVLEGTIAMGEYENATQQVQSDEYMYHTIRQGDTLYDIARMYPGVTVKSLKELNQINNDRRLRLGQKLRITKSAP